MVHLVKMWGFCIIVLVMVCRLGGCLCWFGGGIDILIPVNEDC